MKVKYELSWWDQYDEDRWKSSLLIGILVSILAFMFLDKIKIPIMPQKTIIIEDILFVEESPKKKMEPKKVNPVEKVPEKIPEDINEEIVDFIPPIESPTTNLPINLPVADRVQIFEKQDLTMNISQPEMQISPGEIAPITDDATIELNQGLNTDWVQENISTAITDRHGVQVTENVSSGLSTTILTEPTGANVHFAGVGGEINWEELLDPLLCFIERNNEDIGLVPRRTLAGNDKTVITTKRRIKIPEVGEFEILLVGKKSKRQVTICMIDVKTNQFVYMVDQGLQKKTTIYKQGTVKRNALGQIVEFKYQQKKASDELANSRMRQFWSWAQNIKCEN